MARGQREGQRRQPTLRGQGLQPARLVDAAAGHLALPQRIERRMGAPGLFPVQLAPAGTPRQQREDQAGAVRRAAVDPRAHPQRPVPALHPGRQAFDRREGGPPQQRAVGEDPETEAAGQQIIQIVVKASEVHADSVGAVVLLPQGRDDPSQSQESVMFVTVNCRVHQHRGGSE